MKKPSKNEKVVLSIFFILICLLFALPSQAVFAVTSKEMMFPAHFVAKLLHGICLAVGIGLIISGMVKFNEYRRHKDVGFSVIFFLILTGAALIGIGLLPLPETG